MMDLDVGICSEVEKKQKKKLLLDYLWDNLKNHNWWAYRYYLCELLALLNVIGECVDVLLSSECLCTADEVCFVLGVCVRESQATFPFFLLFPSSHRRLPPPRLEQTKSKPLYLLVRFEVGRTKEK